MTTDRMGEGAEELFRRRATSVGLPAERRRVSGRSAGQWLVAVLLVVGSLVGAAWLYAQKGDTAEVLVLARPVPAGEEITSGDLTTAQVSGVSDAIAADEAGTVIGRHAIVGMVPGQVLVPDAVTDQPLPAPGDRMVAVNVPAGRLPAGVQAGSAVEVLVAPAPGQGSTPEQLAEPEVLAARAVAHGVDVVDDGSVVLTLLIADAEADQVAAYSAAGAVTVVQIPVGE